MTSNLAHKADAIATVRTMVAEAARLRKTRLASEKLLAQWRGHAVAARAMARRAGCADQKINDTVELATRTLLTADQVQKARLPTDFSTQEGALASLERAVKVRDWHSKQLSDATSALEAVLRDLQAVQRLVTAAATLSEDEMARAVDDAARSVGLPARELDGGGPVAERPIVELVERLLRQEKHPMKTKDLVERMRRLGRPIDVPNPAATVRGALLARKTGPVVWLRRGLWGLAEWGMTATGLTARADAATPRAPTKKSKGKK